MKCNRNVIVYLFYRFGHVSVFLDNLMPIKSIHPDAYANSCSSGMILNGPICHGTVKICPKNHRDREFCSPVLCLCSIDSNCLAVTDQWLWQPYSVLKVLIVSKLLLTESYGNYNYAIFCLCYKGFISLYTVQTVQHPTCTSD